MTDYAQEYWGSECGTPEREAEMTCAKCQAGVVHPWHDSGEPNSGDVWRWEKGGPYAAPGH